MSLKVSWFLRIMIGLFVIGAVGVPWSGPAALADSTILPVVLSPAANATVTGEFQGPIRVDFTNVTPAPYWELSVTRADGCPDLWSEPYCYAAISIDGDQARGVIDVYLPVPIQQAGAYNLGIKPSSGIDTLHQSFDLAEGSPSVDPEPTPRADIVRLSPTDGVRLGDTASITVDFADRSVPYPYEIWATNTGATDYFHKIVYATGTETVSLGQMKSYGLHNVSIRDVASRTTYDFTSFYLKVPRPIVGIAHVQPRVFFPILRDGFRDSVRFRYGVEASDLAPWDVNWQVRDVSGTVVASGAAESNVSPGFLTWDGLASDGTPVEAGTYRMMIRVTTLDGGVGADQETFYAERAIARRERLSVAASRTTHRTIRGDCVDKAARGVLTLKCSRGSARVRYAFRTPADAHRFAYRVRGFRKCCADGAVEIEGRRVSPRRYVVMVRVEAPISYTMRRVGLTYTHSIRH